MSSDAGKQKKKEKDLIGQIVPVCLKECHGFYYLGERV